MNRGDATPLEGGVLGLLATDRSNNGIIGPHRRLARNYRSLTNYRLRMLFVAEGVKT